MKSTILLLGEGNFSFAKQLSEAIAQRSSVQTSKNKSVDLNSNNENHTNRKGHREGTEGHIKTEEAIRRKDESEQTYESIKLIASDFKVENPCQENELELDKGICENINFLRRNGTHVLLDVNSCQLDSNERLKNILQCDSADEQELKVIFNYPHVQNIKMKIHLNRELLKGTFQSLQRLLVATVGHYGRVQIFITLCHGQSGINEIEPSDKHRAWADSWQLPEMAAYGRFAITNVLSFDQTFLEELISLHSLAEVRRRQFELNDGKDSSHSAGGGNNNSIVNKYESFGYRNRNVSFNLNASGQKFLGGNVFVLHFRPEEFQFDVTPDCNWNELSAIYRQKFFNPDMEGEFVETYGLLFPQSFVRDVSFGVYVPEKTSGDLGTDNRTLLIGEISRLLSNILVDVQFRELYQLSKTESSYCFRLNICSRILPLNRERVIDILAKLQTTICDRYPNITAR